MHPSSSQVLTATLLNDQALLNFRVGLADGITLLCRRGAEPDFAPIAEDDPSPVVDSRPNLMPGRPEIRCYRAILRYSGSENRQLSNEVRLTLP